MFKNGHMIKEITHSLLCYMEFIELAKFLSNISLNEHAHEISVLITLANNKGSEEIGNSHILTHKI